MSKSDINRVDFYQTFFEESEGYAEKQINGYWLIRHWDGNKKQETIDLFTEESYQNYKRGGLAFLQRKNKELEINLFT